MHISVITLFPEMFRCLDLGITGRAQKKGLVQITYLNPRDFTQDKRRSVDDRPFGGGSGMVMKLQPLQEAIRAAKQAFSHEVPVSYLSPQGKRLEQSVIQKLSRRKEFILVTGRYKGIDQRLLGTEIQEEWSIGDFILSGGELAAMCFMDAIIRLLPGVLGNSASYIDDSFTDGLLSAPQYTRPNDNFVPKILLSGDAKAIARWRLKQALGQTWKKRPDLLEKRVLLDQEKVLLAEFIRENI
jgi:tRNA (guanine37-N1)-methyltransferase